MISKWVCTTKDINGLTYGKIYDGELNYNLLIILDDFGTYKEVYLSIEEEVKNYKFSVRRYNFMTLEEWRDRKIEDILKWWIIMTLMKE